MSLVHLGAVEYLNARPLVHGLRHSSLFSLRFDVPSRCAELLHERSIDLGLIPAIEYLRGPAAGSYAIVPGLAIASNGPVASVAIYTTRPIADVRSLALDTSSRTSVALARVLCARVYGIQPVLQSQAPDLAEMLRLADAALIIGDKALLQNGGELDVAAPGQQRQTVTVQKLDLGEAWSKATGLPFVYAFWAGRAGSVTPRHVQALLEARDRGVDQADEVAAEYFAATPEHQALGARYLRDNIKYSLGPSERAGLELFYRYAAEAGVVDGVRVLTFFEQLRRIE